MEEASASQLASVQGRLADGVVSALACAEDPLALQAAGAHVVKASSSSRPKDRQTILARPRAGDGGAMWDRGRVETNPSCFLLSGPFWGRWTRWCMCTRWSVCRTASGHSRKYFRGHMLLLLLLLSRVQQAQKTTSSGLNTPARPPVSCFCRFLASSAFFAVVVICLLAHTRLLCA